MQYFTKGVPLSWDTRQLYGKKTLNGALRLNDVLAKFKKFFNADGGYIVSSPGRVEIVGNHTDHNGGKAVGCTVGLDILAAFRPIKENKIHIKNSGRHDIVIDLNDISTKESGSFGMVKGVVAYLQLQGFCIGGFQAYVSSSVPIGCGVSSSAAFQLLVAQIENMLYNDGKLSPTQMALAGQYAENEYFGKPCGLLDQTVIAVGGVVALDFCNGVSYKRFDSILSDYDIFVVNTGGSHATLTDHYAAIRNDMQSVAALFGKSLLCQVDKQTFFDNADNVKSAVGERCFLRAKHFFEENNRVDQMCHALANNDQQTFVRLVDESGQSSRVQLQNYAVNGDGKIGDAVDWVHRFCPNAVARVHGGGFAGTVLCVVPKSRSLVFATEAAAHFGVKNVVKTSPRPLGVCVL